MDKLLYRIMSGKIIVDIGKRYIIQPVKYEYKYLAEELYEKVLEECLSEDIISKEDKMFELMLFRNKLPIDYKEQLKSKQKLVEDKKVSLYEFVNEKNHQEAEKVRAEINNLTAEIVKILERKHCLDSISAEGIAEMEKHKYLMRKSISKKVGNKSLERIVEWLSKNYIREADYRAIVKSNTFLNLVNAKPSLFRNYPVTDEQTMLMYWHKFYRNVYKSQDRPFEWVIADDMALDGWYISQSRKRAMGDSNSYIESKMHSDGTRSATELYVIAPPEMSDTIHNANDAGGKAYIKTMRSLVDKGKLNESTENALGKGFGVRG